MLNFFQCLLLTSGAQSFLVNQYSFSILRSSIPNFLGKFNESVRLVAEKFTLIKTSRLSNTIKIRHPLNRIERKGWIKIYSPPSWNDGIKLNTDPDKPKVLHIYATFRKQYVYP